MSRYYQITLTKPGDSNPTRTFTSFPNGVNDPGALNVIVDAYVYSYDAAAQQAAVQIWGVSLSDLGQAANFTGMTIKFYGGFQKGLPLNNPAQAGLLFQGTVFQSFANWQGTDMTLDFVVTVSGALASENAPITLNWQAGQQLSTALKIALTNAFPGVKVTVNISDKLSLSYPNPGVYQSLTALAQTLKPLSQSIVGGASYQGVSISMNGSGILVQDGTVKQSPLQIAFQDLIGQPTWIFNQTIQIMCPMRYDISVGTFISMPQGLLGSGSNNYGVPGTITTTTASQPQTRQSSIFTGSFLVQSVHHMGNFRDPNGMSWVTVIEAVIMPTTN